ncbi:MAG: ATP-dependent sacrificial sulfur transferase LarE [Methanoculleus sp.]|jgi:uncharacterized protein|uniref:ATP-dependent sacrificial sulfur transferase LarE n=1 Tax=Methanoculleus sp. TaxID=90427 RepID=UPI002626D0E2|nr:ATP-dependent sacrificial sulfur transferase LarE [Methanoculleus sp.]MCK9305920.1 ATP-dependent sacrificial sulfur transferase LarE [Methanoculleus sp.]MDD2254324.1 ATP-dependent sacrificial sulfur transferase LarE [Methanoculleus sp.]MDD4314765.1 ATP-dependent sacrificial sulfur transferase LarE [Methanoculleus sp.]MDD4471140.1 ATP-dependent sacrificial sulfur transferase LarE [Methanoculleus sp.]
MTRDAKRALLERKIAEKGSMLVAFSGGVDSGLLAVIARDLLGEKAHCVFLDGPLVPRSALAEAEAMARDLCLSFEIVRAPGLDRDFRRNPPDRCYHCKKKDAAILKTKAKERGLAVVADGINLSDTTEHRPGLAASSEEGIVHPFIEAGMTKSDIRHIARESGLSFWNKPSAACLSSRIPYGEEITDAKLRMVESAEELLHELGFGQVRVRCHGAIARIEVEPAEMDRLLAERRAIVARFKEAGFSYVALDLEGYRSGSMDEVL